MNGNTITFKIEPRPTWRRADRAKAEVGSQQDSKTESPSTPKAPTVPRLARMLALAHHIEALIESGDLRDAAHAARLLGVSRARITQVMNLLLLPTRAQEDVLLGRVKASERSLRAALKDPIWPAAGGTE